MTTPHPQTKLEHYTAGGINIRQHAVDSIYDEHGKDVTILIKTARVGATSNIIARGVDKKLKVVAFEPTHDIIKKTVLGIVPQYTESNPTSVHVLPNTFCRKNKSLVTQYPMLKRLAMIPIPMDCYKCDLFEACECTDLLTMGDVDITVLTYHKMHTLEKANQHGHDGFRKDMLDAIYDADVFVLDEAHLVAYGIVTDIELRKTNMSDYDNLSHVHYPITHLIVERFKNMISGNALSDICNKIYADAYGSSIGKKVLAGTFVNFESQFDVPTGKIVSSVHGELVHLCIDGGIPIHAINQVYKMLNIVTSETVAVCGTKISTGKREKDYKVDWTISVTEPFDLSGIPIDDKMVIITSATVTSNTFNQQFGKCVEVLFGGNGDPLDTNGKMVVFADSKQYGNMGKTSLHHQDVIDEVVTDIIEIAGDAPDEYMIIAMSKNAEYEFNVAFERRGFAGVATYYNANGTIGVESNHRKGICIGAAEKPSNAYDATNENSKIKRTESVDEDTNQAISRLKDPNGIEASYVYMLGVNRSRATSVTTWGTNRTVCEDGSVKCDEYIKPPILVMKPERVSWGEVKVLHGDTNTLNMCRGNNLDLYEACVMKTVANCQKAVGVTYIKNQNETISMRTLRRRIQNLVERGLLIETVGENKTKYFTICEQYGRK